MELVRPGGQRGRVHFVGDDQHRAAAAPEHVPDLLVLRRQPRGGIDDEQHGARAGDGALGLPPDLHDERFGGARNEPAGINQHELAPGPFAGRLEKIKSRSFPALDALAIPYEVIFINDGSHDRSAALLKDQFIARPDVTRVVLFNANYGQHLAVIAGFERVRGQRVVTLDADLQNPPEEVHRIP